MGKFLECSVWERKKRGNYKLMKRLVKSQITPSAEIILLAEEIMQLAREENFSYSPFSNRILLPTEVSGWYFISSLRMKTRVCFPQQLNSRSFTILRSFRVRPRHNRCIKISQPKLLPHSELNRVLFVSFILIAKTKRNTEKRK